MEDEEGGERIAASLHNVTIETAGTEEEVAEGLEDAMGISTQEMEVKGYRVSKGEDEGDWNQRSLGALAFLSRKL